MRIDKWNKMEEIERERLLVILIYKYISTKTSLEINVGLTDSGNNS